MNKSYKDYALGSFLSLSLLLLSTPLFAVESYDLPSGEWRQISLPLEPVSPNNTVSAIFADDIPDVDGSPAEYGEHWVVYSYNSADGRYKREDPGNTLKQGMGYWITQITGSVDPAQLDMPGDSVAGSDPFSIPLAAPTGEGSVGWNMVGHPLTVPIEFSNYRIKTSSTPCSGQGCGPAQEEAINIFHKEIWRYNGDAYEKLTGDDTLNPWDGFWGATLEGSTGIDPQLFIASSALLPPVAGNWNLRFQEEFEGDTLNPAKWRMGGHHLGIAGNAGNSSEQVSVGDGNLKLLAEAKPVTYANKDGQLWDFDYSSGEISTFKQFRQLYGYFEARIKYDVTKGVWPAFWTMPDRGNYGPGNRTYESFMRFDLPEISPSITKATLKVKVTGFSSYDNPSNLLVNMTTHKLNSNDWSWSDTSVNWNNKPAYDPVWLDQKMWKKPTPGDSAQLASASQETLEDAGYTDEEYSQAQLESNKNNLYPSEPSMQEVISVSSAESAANVDEIHIGDIIEIDVTHYIKSQLAANKSTAGFALVDTFRRDHGISFASREAEADSPQLVIDGVAPIYPKADASVREGFPTTNYGTDLELNVRDPWKSTSSTHHGGMEIDIMESLGNWGNNTQHATHWDGYRDDWKHKNSGQVALSSADYHTYGMSWQPDRIDFYIDGVKSGWSFPPDGTNTSPGIIESYILLSHQLGGWPKSGNTIPAGFGSATMLVDHVRVWSGSPSP